MMKNGFRVWDTDTHIRPSLETLDPYFDPAFRARFPEIEKFRRVIESDEEGQVPGRHTYAFPGAQATRPNRRTLGQAAGPDPRAPLPERKYMGRRQATLGAIDFDADTRVRDMDEEGVDVQVMIGNGPNPALLNDVELQVGFLRAYNRYLNDFCSRHPHRLKAVIPVLPNAVEEATAQIKQWADSAWMVGVYPMMTNDTPMDHPDMDPIWEAVNENGLVVLHHSQYAGPPYYPAYGDLWNNPFLARSAAHPWGAMRAIGSFIGAGLMERYTSLRFGILECGCGWLPFWSRRLDDQAEYVGWVPKLEHRIGEHLTGGRFFSSIEMAEGEDMIQMVVDFMGPGVLMYASDYPHFECRFPDSVDYFFGWKSLGDDLRQQLLWENAVRFYGEP